MGRVSYFLLRLNYSEAGVSKEKEKLSPPMGHVNLSKEGNILGAHAQMHTHIHTHGRELYF